MVHQCTKFNFERTHHKQVIGTNTFYCLHEAVCLQTCNVYIMILMMGYKVLSLLVLVSIFYWSLSLSTVVLSIL